MKSFTKIMIGVGLTAATMAGAVVPATAATTDSTEPTVQLIWKDGAGNFKSVYHYSYDNGGNPTDGYVQNHYYAEQFSTLSNAVAGTTKYVATSVGDGWFTLSSGITGSVMCLGMLPSTPGGGSLLQLAHCDSNVNTQLWQFNNEGSLVSKDAGVIGDYGYEQKTETNPGATTDFYYFSMKAGVGEYEFVGSKGDMEISESAVDVMTPADGSTVTEANPVFSGTGEPDGTVVVTDVNGVELANATVQADGTWSVASVVALANGAVTATATQTSMTGVVTTDATSFTVNVAPVVADPIVVTTPAAGATVSDEFVTYAGTGDPGALIEVKGIATGRVLASATVAADGTWTAVSTLALGAGSYTVAAHQAPLAGAASQVNVSFVIQLRAVVPITNTSDAVSFKANPTFKGQGDPGATIEVKGISGRVLAATTVNPDGSWSVDSTIALPIDGNYTVFATQVATNGATSNVDIAFRIASNVAVSTPAQGATVTTATPSWTGTGQSGAAIEIRGMSGRVLATATVGANGTWASTPSVFNLVDQEYTVKVHQMVDGVDGFVMSNFIIDTP